MCGLKRKGFSMVEIIIVIIVIAIITAFLLLGGSTTNVVDDNAEADKVVRALESLRSGWISYYADKQEFLGVVSGDQEYDATAPFTKSLEVYLDRPLDDDIEKYGNIYISTVTGSGAGSAAKIYLGFKFPANSLPRDSVLKILEQNANEQGLYTHTSSGYNTFSATNNTSILFRVY